MTAAGETGSVDDRDIAKLRLPPHRKILSTIASKIAVHSAAPP
ncbi:hypothetical protein ACNJYD_00300 [Bradyrhizobium sp. DASA03005]|nr:hypothetical protein [Bradyrhizobium liaoningense]